MYNIYGLKWCVFCLRAINTLHEKSISFTYHAMDDKPSVLNYIKETYDHKTVPIITRDIDGEEQFIGGYDDLVKYLHQPEDEKSN